MARDFRLSYSFSVYLVRNDIEKKKVAIVAYGCNKTRLVPLEQLKIIRKVEENET